MEKSIIQQDIEYFVYNYSLIELFCGIWANYSVLKGSNTNESQKKKKRFNYYIYCYQEACYKKWDARFPDFLFLKESFRKQLKLYRPPGLWCSETELIEYANFLCGIKRIISSLMKKVYFFLARNK